MSAERLRTAAALMRGRAKAATPGPWRMLGGNEYVSPIGLLVAPDDGGVSGDDATHIAAWHPAVALAVADLLDVWADNDLLGSPFTLPEERQCITDMADAYLRSTS